MAATINYFNEFPLYDTDKIGMLGVMLFKVSYLHTSQNFMFLSYHLSVYGILKLGV